MGNFNRDTGFGGGRSLSRRGFGRKDSGKPSMYKTTCSKCGNECEVPFKPSGGKPVFCSKCFEKSGTSNSRRPGARNYGRSNFDDKRMYEAVCDKCGDKCKVPFQPTSGKPIYCSQCFKKGDETQGKNTEQLKKQFEILNIKLDKILTALFPNKVSKKQVKKIDISKKAVEKRQKLPYYAKKLNKASRSSKQRL